jgi:hypothetical protein
MRTLWACALAVSLAVAPVRAEVGPADRAAIEATIRGQIAAFARDDAEAAYAFASRTIQSLFPTADFFMAMVRRAYAPLYRASDPRFRPAEETEAGIRQPMLFRGPDGRVWLAIYTMQRQPDGGFRIDGCTLVALPDASA